MQKLGRSMDYEVILTIPTKAQLDHIIQYILFFVTIYLGIMLFYKKGKAGEAAAPQNNISVLQSNSRQLLGIVGGYFLFMAKG